MNTQEKNSEKKTFKIKPETYVVLFSGGLDSTYALWYCVAKTDNPVHTHHVIIRNDVSKRWKEEREACRDIVDYLQKNYRDFDYSESGFDFFNFRNVNWDVDIALIAGIMVARNIMGLKRIVSGPTKSDLDRNPHIPSDILKSAIMPKDCIYEEGFRPGITKTKKEIYDEMPKELSKLAWSCRHPNNGKPCGECKACRLRIEEGIPL